jgi:SAM-dependent methyltransferase
MKDEVREYWSSPSSKKVQTHLQVAKTFDAPRPPQAEDELLVEWFVGPRYQGRTVLDVGAGAGRMVRRWSDLGVRLTSVEFSEAFLPDLERLSREHGQECHRLDVAKGRLDRTFDLVFATQVLLHIHPSEIRAALRNLRAMAGGDALFITGALEPPFDDEDTTRIQSFRHDYDTLFAELGWEPRLDMILKRRFNAQGPCGGRTKLNRVLFFSG